MITGPLASSATLNSDKSPCIKSAQSIRLQALGNFHAAGV